MKILIKTRKELKIEGRWDIDYHLPPEGIKAFPENIIKKVSEVAEIVKDKKDPTKEPAVSFTYVDISSVNVLSGVIENPQDLTGDEAPSRARKLVAKDDIIISTCRPTRGAIAVIPEKLNDEICSTGFSVVRAKEGINPLYLHFALRLDSTLEQFRKWSTGSSYPAILDEDIAKTRIPVPNKETQDLIADLVSEANHIRNQVVTKADSRLKKVFGDMVEGLSSGKVNKESVYTNFKEFMIVNFENGHVERA
jgi:type I restriction enzyme S subunit